MIYQFSWKADLFSEIYANDGYNVVGVFGFPSGCERVVIAAHICTNCFCCTHICKQYAHTKGRFAIYNEPPSHTCSLPFIYRNHSLPTLSRISSWRCYKNLIVFEMEIIKNLIEKELILGTYALIYEWCWGFYLIINKGLI